MKKWHNYIYLSIYSAILLVSEILYRIVFDIIPLYRIFESFIVLFAVLALFLFSKYKITRFCIASFFALSIIVNNVHHEVYSNWINGINYFLMLKEWWEVLYSGVPMFGKIAGGLFWGIAEVVFFVSISRFRKKTFVGIDILFACVMIYIFIRSFYTRQELGVTSNPGYSRVKSNFFAFGYFIGRTTPYELFHLSKVPVYEAPAPKISGEPKVKNIIFIVGESAKAENCSVFGYTKHKTTPFLEQLYKEYPTTTMKVAYSAGMQTSVSLPMLFNAIPYPNGMQQIMSGRTNLFRLAKEQGFSTYFYSAQPENQMMIISLMGKTWIDDLRFPTSFGYGVKEIMHDHKLYPLLTDIDLDNGRNFVVLHQRGSHGPVGGILSKEEMVFSDATLIDKYDSTIYNTDLLIKKVFNYLQKRDKDDWILVYTSDHGVIVFSQGDEKYLVPLCIYSPNKNIEDIQKQFVGCEKMFHQQLATFLINIMGYDMQISDCKKGTVNFVLLTGDAGYYIVENGKEPVAIYPK